MKNHWLKLLVIALAVAVVAGCASKQNTSRQSDNDTATRTATAAPADAPAPNTASDPADDSATDTATVQDEEPTVSNASTASKSVKEVDPPSSSTQAKVATKSTATSTKSAAANRAANTPKIQKADAKSNEKPRPTANTTKQLPRLLDLGATKCIPCKMMVPVLDELTKEYKGKLKVEFIDVWENQAAAEKYKVQSIPTQIFFNANGKEVYRHTGFISKEDILKTFKEHNIHLSEE